MSLLAAIVMLATPAAAAAEAPPADASPIVVIGQRLKDWRGTWGSKKGVLVCRTTRSTGDGEIDAIGCSALVACASPLVPQFQAIAAAKLSRRERERRLSAASQAMIPCLEREREAGIAALADRRSAA